MEEDMQDSTRRLMDEPEWWRRVGEETHHTLTDTAHELSDETARTLQLLALLCGALTHDAGWSADDVQALIATVGERLPYVPTIITDEVAALLRTGYRGL